MARIITNHCLDIIANIIVIQYNIVTNSIIPKVKNVSKSPSIINKNIYNTSDKYVILTILFFFSTKFSYHIAPFYPIFKIIGFLLVNSINLVMPIFVLNNNFAAIA